MVIHLIPVDFGGNDHSQFDLFGSCVRSCVSIVASSAFSASVGPSQRAFKAHLFQSPSLRAGVFVADSSGGVFGLQYSLLRYRQ